jgi:hypothetical protein
MVRVRVLLFGRRYELRRLNLQHERLASRRPTSRLMELRTSRIVYVMSEPVYTMIGLVMCGLMDLSVDYCVYVFRLVVETFGLVYGLLCIYVCRF